MLGLLCFNGLGCIDLQNILSAILCLRSNIELGFVPGHAQASGGFYYSLGRLLDSVGFGPGRSAGQTARRTKFARISGDFAGILRGNSFLELETSV